MNAPFSVDGNVDDFATGLLNQVRDYMTTTEQEMIGNATPVLQLSCDQATADKLDKSADFQARLQAIAAEKGFWVHLQWLSRGSHCNPYLSFRVAPAAPTPA
jgi:hypothetical protein